MPEVFNEGLGIHFECATGEPLFCFLSFSCFRRPCVLLFCDCFVISTGVSSLLAASPSQAIIPSCLFLFLFSLPLSRVGWIHLFMNGLMARSWCSLRGTQHTSWILHVSLRTSRSTPEIIQGATLSIDRHVDTATYVRFSPVK